MNIKHKLQIYSQKYLLIGRSRLKAHCGVAISPKIKGKFGNIALWLTSIKYRHYITKLFQFQVNNDNKRPQNSLFPPTANPNALCIPAASSSRRPT